MEIVTGTMQDTKDYEAQRWIKRWMPLWRNKNLLKLTVNTRDIFQIAISVQYYLKLKRVKWSTVDRTKNQTLSFRLYAKRKLSSSFKVFDWLMCITIKNY